MAWSRLFGVIFVTLMHTSVPSFDAHTSPGEYFLTPTLIDFDRAEPRILLSLSAHLLLLLFLLLLIFFFLLLDGCSHPIRRTMTAGKRQAPSTKRLSRRISKILKRGRVLRQVIGPFPFSGFMCFSCCASHGVPLHVHTCRAVGSLGACSSSV